MASNSFPIDPLQTQLVSPTTNVRTPSVAGPQSTGLSEGLRTFSRALGTVAEEYVKKEEEAEKITAGLYAAMGKVAPGLVTEAGMLHNYKLLDDIFVDTTLKQIEVYNDNAAKEIAASSQYTKDFKAKHFSALLNNVRDKAKRTVFHNGEALGRLFVALNGYKAQWDMDIANAEHLQAVQTTTQATIAKTEIHVSNKGNWDIPFIKSISETIRKADLIPPFEIIGGVEFRTHPKLDADKTAYVIASNTAIKNLGSIPKLYRQLLELRKTYFKKSADTESALLASGQTVLIGDDKSFATLFKATDDAVTAWLKKNGKDDKETNETLFTKFVQGKLDRGETWLAKDTQTLFAIWEHDAPTYIKKVKTILNAAKHGENSEVFRTLIRDIGDPKLGPHMSMQWFEGQILGDTENKVFGLTPEAAAIARRIFTENKTVITNNITSLKDAVPSLTFNKIYNEITNQNLKRSFLAELHKRNKTLEDGITKPWLESWLKEKSTIKYAKQVRSFITAAQGIFLRTQSVITDLSIDRTLQRGKFSDKEQHPGKDFNRDEIEAITTELLNAFLKGEHGLTSIANITNKEIIELEKILPHNPTILEKQQK